MKPTEYPRLGPADFARLFVRYRVVRRGRWVCWELEGAKTDRYGYARFWLGGQWRQAHRVSFQWLVAEAPEPVLRSRRRRVPPDRPQLDHRCGNEACIRPGHIEPVTHQRNQELRVLRNPRYRTFRGRPKGEVA